MLLEAACWLPLCSSQLRPGPPPPPRSDPVAQAAVRMGKLFLASRAEELLPRFPVRSRQSLWLPRWRLSLPWTEGAN